MKGTSLETIESQTQPELLYKGLESHAEARRSEATPAAIQARAVLEAVAEAAMDQAATQSMMAVPDTTHRAKVRRTDSDEYEWVRNPVTESQSKKIAEGRSDKKLLKMTQLSNRCRRWGQKMDLSVKTLETQMKEGFVKEGLQRKQENESLEKKMMSQNG